MFIQGKGQNVVATMDTLSPLLGRGINTDRAAVTLLSGAGAVSYRKLYRSQPWVFVAVNAIARRLASMPFQAYDREAGTRNRTMLHPESNDLASLLKKPFTGGSWFDFQESVANEYLVHGKALVWIDRQPGAPPSQIVPLDMDQVVMRRNYIGEITVFEWREFPGSTPTLLMPEDVVWFGFSRGVSPLEALARTLAVEDAAQRSTQAFYENGARPAGILTAESPIDEPDVKRIEAMVGSRHKGVDNAFRLAVLANVPSLKWQQFDATAEDAKTIEFRKLNREEVIAAYTVPPPIAGILDRANFSNVETLKDQWIVESIGVHAAMFEQRFEAQIIEPFRYIYGDRVFVEHDLSAALRGSPAVQAETYTKLLLAGVYTPNDLRQLENLPPINDPLADAVYVPKASGPVGGPGKAVGESFAYDLDGGVITVNDRREQLGLGPHPSGLGNLTMPQMLIILGVNADPLAPSTPGPPPPAV